VSVPFEKPDRPVSLRATGPDTADHSNHEIVKRFLQIVFELYNHVE
jgi:hypothetical protein